jgi:hypothetical protein
MNSQDTDFKIWMPLRAVVGFAALINLFVGFMFLIGPELGVTLWPSAVGSTISRFIGAIIFANGIGSALVTWNGKWENARVLFTVALTYGVIVLLALPIDLLMYQKDLILWGYVAIDAIFLLPIGAIFLAYEFRRWRSRNAKPAVAAAARQPVAAQPARGTLQ